MDLELNGENLGEVQSVTITRREYVYSERLGERILIGDSLKPIKMFEVEEQYWDDAVIPTHKNCPCTIIDHITSEEILEEFDVPLLEDEEDAEAEFYDQFDEEEE